MEEKQEISIIYGTTGGTAKKFAELLFSELDFPQKQIYDIATFDGETLADKRTKSTESEKAHYCLFVMATTGEGKPPKDAERFMKWAAENAVDQRAGSAYLHGVRYGVFGLGDSRFGKKAFIRPAREVCDSLNTSRTSYFPPSPQLDRYFHELGARRLYPVGVGDEAKEYLKDENKKLKQSNDVTQKSKEEETEKDSKEKQNQAESSQADRTEGERVKALRQWIRGVSRSLHAIFDAAKAKDKKALEDYDAARDAAIEDFGIEETKEGGPMVTPRLKKQLEHEGYRIVGTHSAVKQCRWAKNALRGRGFCYKNTFYGIRSHQCMEFSCSIACANRCVFCWRHNNNPVSTTWRWEIDDPFTVVQHALDANDKLVIPFKGNNLVTSDVFQEAMHPRHCALSLIGEPVMYPRVNELVRELHRRKITTFMVTNAQMPEMIEKLTPVTQLYISVDAAQRDTLEKVDRSLFSDSWDRLLRSMDIMRTKRKERTVFRLTVVKDWNMADPPTKYAELVKRGVPDFIEVKGATYCGGKGNPLTMKNIPYHDEVLEFAKALAAAAPDYAIASEHEHSCCVLIAHKKFLKEIISEQGEKKTAWFTWLDFDKFFEVEEKLISAELPEPREGRSNTMSELYSAPQPSWCAYGEASRGLNPTQRRVYKNGCQEKEPKKTKTE